MAAVAEAGGEAALAIGLRIRNFLSERPLSSKYSTEPSSID
jgi:hypothetical protein